MSHLYFYFDESFHSRKITKKSFMDTNYFNSYVSVAVCFDNKLKPKLFKRYKVFETIFKNIYCTEEVKSDILSKKNYSKGLASFNKNAVNLYTEYFKFLNDNHIVYYVSVFDKLEYLLLQYRLNVPLFVNQKAIIYSIVKMINVYKPQKVIDDIIRESNTLFDDLKEFFALQLRANGNLKLKEKENLMIIQILSFLDGISGDKIEFTFNYNFIFEGFQKFLARINFDKLNIIIDKEGTSKIVFSAKKMGLKNSRQIDSLRSPGVRVADMLCGFLSRMMRGIYEETYNDSSIPYTKQHLLSIEWFKVNEEQFNLYKLVANYIKSNITNIYSCYCSIYFDLFDQVIGLIYYFDSFNDFTDYSSINLNEHYVDCNNEIMSRIMYHIDELGRKT